MRIGCVFAPLTGSHLQIAGAGPWEIHPVQRASVDARLGEVKAGGNDYQVPGRTAVVFVEPR